jgi:hypothetical protein
MSMTSRTNAVTDSVGFKLAAAFVAMVAVPVFLWLFYAAESDLKDHGQALSRISETLTGLRDGQNRIERAFDSRVDRVQDEIDRLEQATADSNRGMMPRRVQPN